MTPTLLAILAYVVAQLAIGAWVARRVHTEQDYLVAGRSLGPVLSTFTIFATWFGAETCIGAAGQAYGAGIYATAADPFGYALCLVLMGAIFAVPLWKRKLTTLADLFGERFGPGPERLATLLMVPTSVMWAGAQVRAFGQILGAASELSLTVAITIATVVVVIYTSMGGLLADAISDAVQGSVLLLGLGLVLALVLTGGGAAAFEQLSADALSFSEPGTSHLATAEAWAIPILGSVVAQELVARVAAARSPQIARRSAVLAGCMYLLVGAVPVALGLSASVLMPDLPEQDQVLAHMAQRYLPAPLYVVFLGALVSAILSTVDSALLVAGSLLAHNLWVPLRGVRDDALKLRASRFFVVGCGLFAYGLALSAEGVYALVEEASALGSAGIVVCVVFGLFSPLGGSRAATAALLLGLVVYAAAAHLSALTAPYLTSVLAAAAGFLVFSRFEAAPRSRAER